MADRSSDKATAMMPHCCMQSFVARGIREAMKVANEGDEHQCDLCARRWRLVHGIWTQQKAH